MNNNKYNSREEEIRAELSFEEVVHRIKDVYHAEYDSKRPQFDVWNQLLACEAVAESIPVNRDDDWKTNKNASVNGMISDGCKHNVIFELTQSKRAVVAKLSKCHYRTPPVEIAGLLEEFFREWPSKKGHWLFIAQHWTPRAINRTINQFVKLHISGRITFQIPPAYFTCLIKFRKRRRLVSVKKKESTNINDGCKQHAY